MLASQTIKVGKSFKLHVLLVSRPGFVSRTSPHNVTGVGHYTWQTKENTFFNTNWNGRSYVYCELTSPCLRTQHVDLLVPT